MAGDPRWPAFARSYGFDPRRPVQWEVEALEPAELRRLVLAADDPYVDRDVLARQIAREEEQRRALAPFWTVGIVPVGQVPQPVLSASDGHVVLLPGRTRNGTMGARTNCK